MTRIDIVISNDRHHWGMAKPLIESAIGRGHRCRVLSFCEFRGLVTPAGMDLSFPVEIVKLSRVQRPRRVKGRGGGGRRWLSRWIRSGVWKSTLVPGLKRALEDRPDIVIVFNDAAYPYDRLCRMLSINGIPFVLVQEGIRYDVADSAGEGSLNQGKGGATAIAAWGESSAEYFRRQGAPPESIHLTGNARFDRIHEGELGTESARIRRKLKLRDRTILFLSNPVEFHGYCTSEEKMMLVREFVAGIEPLLAAGRTSLLFKLHSHEDADQFRAIAESSPSGDRIALVNGEDLYSLFHLADAAVIFSTTAGLEAMLFGVPLGVLEIPGVGFLHDYVEERAATPLEWSSPMSEQVERLLAKKGLHQPDVERYLDRSLAVRSRAADATLDLVEDILREGSTADLAQAVG